ncbi:MAG: biosynthetic peptidoglycan transglycosylase [Clostridia bacterium]|nr:biosynthetic peptidoglycan transglycosylase [Clostridia bacterium]
MKTIKRFFAFLILIVIAVSAGIIYLGYNKYIKALEAKPLDAAAEEVRSIEHYTQITEVPQIYIDAVVATEDRRFYYHNGFDIVGTARAIITDIKERKLVEGGSTITQQLAKNLYFPADNSPTRKIAEIFMAVNIEKEYAKEDIFELYMNVIYFGSGYYNIYDASMGYFEKIPANMNDYESTLLAGVPNAPSLYSPKVNSELAHKRQEKVVDCLLKSKYIDEERADKILSVKNT